VSRQQVEALSLNAMQVERLHRCLRSPSGQAVMRTLAGTDQSMTAQQIADTAHVSDSSARDQASRATQLGYAVQTTVQAGHSRMPARSWRITERGRDYMIDHLS
jgi:hypothetical protein